MNINEMKQAVELLANEWNLGKKESNAEGNICAWIYLFEILEETKQMFIYKEGDSLIGFTGYSKYGSKKNIKQRIYGILKIILSNSSKIKNKKGLKNYQNNYSYTPYSLNGYFDGEISILLVDKKYRGKGIGKELLLSVFNAAQKDSMKNIKILTDESCNYPFYEKMRCVNIYTTIAGDEKAYIFEKKLI